MKTIAQQRGELGKSLGSAGRVRVHKTGDPCTPYIVSAIDEGQLLTATLACACGGDVEGMTLEESESNFLCKLEDTLPYP